MVNELSDTSMFGVWCDSGAARELEIDLNSDTAIEVPLVEPDFAWIKNIYPKIDKEIVSAAVNLYAIGVETRSLSVKVFRIIAWDAVSSLDANGRALEPRALSGKEVSGLKNATYPNYALILAAQILA